MCRRSHAESARYLVGAGSQNAHSAGAGSFLSLIPQRSLSPHPITRRGSEQSYRYHHECDATTRPVTMGPDKLGRLNEEHRANFDELKASTLRVARAWAIKETARGLWGYVRRGWALKAWRRWLAWAFRSQLAPMRKAARVIKNNLWGILNAVVLKVTNATSESLNAKIQWVKKNACGFRNRERFRTAIYFHCGGLDLYPRPL